GQVSHFGNARSKRRKLGSNVSGKREAGYEKEKNERMNRNLTREDDQNCCRKRGRRWARAGRARRQLRMISRAGVTLPVPPTPQSGRISCRHGDRSGT